MENIEELVYKAKKRDNLAFTRLIQMLKNDLYKIAKMRLNCEDDIEDAVQETIIVAYKNIGKVRNAQYFKTWLIRVLINKCNEIYKANKRRNYASIDEQIEKDSYDLSEDKNIEKLNFYSLITKLNYDERISLILFYLMEFTTKEISKILKEPESTIRNRIARARSKLKDIYKEENIYG